MRRFTLRSSGKVDMQRKLFTVVHNIEKDRTPCRRMNPEQT